MTVETLDDLFMESLKDIYYAEKQILRALPKMIKNAEAGDLRSLLEKHRKETEGQIGRLDQVFKSVDAKPRGKNCPAIMGIIEEAQEQMGEIEDDSVRDAGIVGSAQAVEHYEISRYGTLIAWARRLGNEKAAGLLEANLTEEKAADQKLTALAEAAVNEDANSPDGEGWDAAPARPGSRSKKTPPRKGRTSHAKTGRAAR